MPTATDYGASPRERSPRPSQKAFSLNDCRARSHPGQVRSPLTRSPIRPRHPVARGVTVAAALAIEREVLVQVMTVIR
jgi:hypothetical protein